MNIRRDPTRRNRNIGTSRSGHGNNNQLVIRMPDRYGFTRYYESLKSYKVTTRTINQSTIHFIVEKTRASSCHACTVDDLAHLLHHVPPTDLEGIELIVLRQPKRKEEILEPVWGRIAYCAEIDEYLGPAIFLEARDLSKPTRWSKSLNPDGEAELARLRCDGHQVITTRRHNVLTSTIESVRSTQLYRTLLHEVGHYVDLHRNSAAFDRKVHREKEVFAHRYADELRRKLYKRGVVPFPRILSEKSIEKDGLLISDFENQLFPSSTIQAKMRL